MRHDISLLRLADDVTFTDFIQPICLPDRNADFSEKTVYMSGWSSFQPGEPSLCNEKFPTFLALQLAVAAHSSSCITLDTVSCTYRFRHDSRGAIHYL